jgi:hypothetical protein
VPLLVGPDQLQGPQGAIDVDRKFQVRVRVLHLDEIEQANGVRSLTNCTTQPFSCTAA